MPISALRDRLTRALLEFSWDEWAQMGVLARAKRRSPWAQDPEALVVFTLEIARDDPRLFDEVLDWLVVNESLLSVRRLRTACTSDEDEQLLDAVLAWVGKHRPSVRLSPRAAPDRGGDPVPLFRRLSLPVEEVDETFAREGLIRSPAEPTGKSNSPDLRAPINFAFRLRQLLGVGVRAEVVRFLLTVDAPAATAQAVAQTAGFAKRNVHDALASMGAAGAISIWTVGPEQRYAAERARWASLFDMPPDEFPTHRDWLQLLSALRETLRFLQGPDLESRSDYMRASQTRDLLERVRPDFAYAGVMVGHSSMAVDAWTDLEATVDQAIGLLRGGLPPSARQDDLFAAGARADGSFAWRLKAANGQVVATSGESFSSHRGASQAAQNLRTKADDWIYEVHPDENGSWRWRARAKNGRTMAVSAGAFRSRHEAERSVHRVRDTAGRDLRVEVLEASHVPPLA
jgi:uncharacterized protein YegP (UPF0339 family)